MKYYDEIQKLFEQNNGLLRTAQLLERGIPNFYLTILMDEGKIIRHKRGVYQWIEAGEKEEIEILTEILPEVILCMESALYHYGYTDRTPYCWHVAVNKDANKKRYNLEYPLVKPYYWEEKILRIGITEVQIGDCTVHMYDRDRTICDILRFAGRMDKEIVNKAIRAYLADPKRNLSNLMKYAAELRVMHKVNQWIGVWV